MTRRSRAVSLKFLTPLLAALAGAYGATGASAQDAEPVFVPPQPDTVRRYLIVPIKFEDSLGQPLKPQDYYVNLFTDSRLGAQIFFRAASNYHFSIGGHKPPPDPAIAAGGAAAPAPAPGAEGEATVTTNTEIAEPTVLPKPASAYQNTGDDGTAAGSWNQQQLVDELVPVLEQTIDLTKFYGLALFPNVSDKPGLPASARAQYKPKGEANRVPIATLCLNPTNLSLSALVREIGRHLDIGDTHVGPGLPEDATMKTDASAMTFTGAADNRLGTLTCDFTMAQKQSARWTSPKDVQVIEPPVAYVYRLYPRCGAMDSLRMVKIPLKTDGDFVTLEAVLPTLIDRVSGLTSFGVLAHKVHENDNTPAHADLGAISAADQPEVIVTPKGSLFFQRGETWTAPGGEATFKVERVTAEFCDVRVTAK